jgi:hypothetical protein
MDDTASMLSKAAEITDRGRFRERAGALRV